MAKGREKHEARQAELSRFGKDLARRSKSVCELCEEPGKALRVFEVPPEPKDPDFEKCAFLCEECCEQVENEKKFRAGEHWRCLAQTVWSEVPAVQVLAVRLLRRQVNAQAWAREVLDGVFLDEEVEAWADEAQ